MSKVRLLLTIPLALGLVWLAAGCSDKNPNAPAKVAGSVSYKGQPVKGGTVGFHPASGGAYSAIITPQGTYVVSDVPVGEMVVTVETESVKPDQKQSKYGGKVQGQMQGQQKPPPGAHGAAFEYTEIPKKYGDPKQTTVKTTLNRGNNTYDIKLD